MKLYKTGRYTEGKWAEEGSILLGVGSPFSGEAAEERIEGTVDKITDDAVYVTYSGGTRAMAATVRVDHKLVMNPDFQNAKFEPPPIPLCSSFVGDVGYDHSENCASVALSYSGEDGWRLGASDGGITDAVPVENYYGHILTYELVRTSILVLHTEDRDRFVKPLGGDLAQLLARIAAGHRIEWDGNNHVGVLTPDARKADHELSDRIERAHFDVPETSTAYGVLGPEYTFEPGDTPESILADAEDEVGRVWGGVDAVKNAMAEYIHGTRPRRELR